MTDGSAQPLARSPDEMRAFIDELSPDDTNRLALYATRLAQTAGGIEAEDLLQNAFIAAISGSRQCPLDVPPLTFLMGAMKSDLFNERRKNQRFQSSTGHEEELDAVDDYTPERRLEWMDQLKRFAAELKDAFGDDDKPMLAFEGRIEGMNREEIRELVGLDIVQYESLERKIRRYMSARISDGRAR